MPRQPNEAPAMGSMVAYKHLTADGVQARPAMVMAVSELPDVNGAPLLHLMVFFTPLDGFGAHAAVQYRMNVEHQAAGDNSPNTWTDL